MIYLDNAGTTKPLKEVINYAKEIQEEFYFNPSAGYTMARKTRNLIDKARENIAIVTNSKQENIIFTSSATEANNQIIRSFIDSNKNHEYIFSEGEHPSVYNVALDLRAKGYKVLFIPLKRDGSINEEILYQSVNENTRFVSIMYVSNETGAINDIERISKRLRELNSSIIIHSDCVQALGKISVNFKKLGVDAITISSHKINSVKGAGAIICKNANKLKPFILGGGQENTLRSGTENVEAICAFGLACQKIDLKKSEEISKMNEYIKNYLTENLGKDVIIVSDKNCIPNTISVIFKNLKSEVFARYLDDFGVIVSKGSACSTRKSGNRVLESMGYTSDEIIGNIRISIGVLNTKEEIEQAIEIMVNKYKELKERMRI